MEGAPLAAVGPRLLSEDLGEHGGRVGAPGQQVTVVAVGGEAHVSRLELRQGRHAGGLLADVDVEVADGVLAGQVDQPLLEAADDQHPAQVVREAIGP